MPPRNGHAGVRRNHVALDVPELVYRHDVVVEEPPVRAADPEPHRPTADQRIADDQWCEIKKLLPENIDDTPVRIELERIARDDTTPTERAKECEERARRSRQTLGLTVSGSSLAPANSSRR